MSALIKCKACGAEISRNATLCPRCGQPRKRNANSGCALILLALLGIFIYGLISGGGGPSADAGQTAHGSPVSSVDCKKDLRCIGEKLVADAEISIACRHKVDARAKNDSQWDDGILSPRFSKFAWQAAPGGNVVLLGDRVRFQNGFGNFVRMSYACTVNPDSHTIVETQVYQGKLPD